MIGMKDFYEALHDGYKHVTDITNIELLRKYRSEGVNIDSEGYYYFPFGEHKEFELRIEPILDEDMFYVALYKGSVLLTEKLPIKALLGDEDKK